jgi:hypothetical protein
MKPQADQRMRHTLGNDLNFGMLPSNNDTLGFSRTDRDKHLYICGATGTGKSKFIEHLIRQDIINWRDTKCGMLVLDPHGSLYDSLLNWLAWNKIDRPIVPIDLRRDDWIVSYNVVRQREADPAVLVDNLTDAMAYVWGQGGTNQTPLFARWAGNVIRTLYEKRLTLVEAEHLVDRVGRQLRSAMTANLSDTPSRQDWEFANTLTAKEFESQIGSTVNRLQRFIRNQTMRAMFGQPGVSLDLGKALAEGSIVLVSLATEQAKVSKENAELFATLLLSDLWTAAQERGKRNGVRPFYVYMDEFQRFITPTIAEGLDEARGYGLHMTMAHQFPNQLLDRGENGRRVYNSIMENASSKVVFRLSHEDNLKAMAQWLFRGVMDPDQIKLELFGTKVMGYREEIRETVTEGESWSESEGSQEGRSSGAGQGGTRTYGGDDEAMDYNPEDDPALSRSHSWSEFSADSSSRSESYTTGRSRSRSWVPTLIPVMGKELTQVQFRSLQEQLFRCMAALFEQKQRHAIARLVGTSVPVSIVTPDVRDYPATPRMVAAYLNRRYRKLPFALRGADAHAQITDTARNFADSVFNDSAAEPQTARRTLKKL